MYDQMSRFVMISSRNHYIFNAGKLTRKQVKEYEFIATSALFYNYEMHFNKTDDQYIYNDQEDLIQDLIKICDRVRHLDDVYVSVKYSLITEKERKKHENKKSNKEGCHYIKPSCCSETDCMICMEELKSGVKTECGKVFHKECMENWIQINNSCPNCRKKEPKLTKFKFIYNVKDGFNEIKTDDFSVKELKQLCKENDIKGYTKLKKQELLNLFGL
jgi:hypothetical protein